MIQKNEAIKKYLERLQRRRWVLARLIEKSKSGSVDGPSAKFVFIFKREKK